jgi:hypothetical protein
VPERPSLGALLPADVDQTWSVAGLELFATQAVTSVPQCIKQD